MSGAGNHGITSQFALPGPGLVVMGRIQYILNI